MTHETEFMPRSIWRNFETSAQYWMREFGLIRENLFNMGTAQSFGGAGGILFSLGVLEGMLQFKRGPGYAKYCGRYGLASVWPSFIQESIAAADVAKLCGSKPERVLRELRRSKGGPGTSLTLHRVHKLAVCRGLFASLFGISQIVKLTDATSEASRELRKSIVSGKEPFFDPTKISLVNSGHRHRERIIRLSGSGSDCTLLSTERYGEHIIPIVEETDGFFKSMVQKITDNGRSPGVWKVRNNEYGRKEDWEGFEVCADWMLPVDSGEGGGSKDGRVLVVEADATIGGGCHIALSDRRGGAEHADLSLQEASQAFDMIERKAQASGVMDGSNRICRIILADAHRTITTGGGNETFVRKLATRENHIDVLIDARIPILACMQRWADGAWSKAAKMRGLQAVPLKAGEENDSIVSGQGYGPRVRWIDPTSGREVQKEICFDTSNSTYFHQMRKIFSRAGWRVHDRNDKSPEDMKLMPRLVHEHRTLDCTNNLRALFRPGVGCGGIENEHCAPEIGKEDERAKKEALEVCRLPRWELENPAVWGHFAPQIA
jgi:hypothetical protein